MDDAIDPRLVEGYFAFMEAGQLLEQVMETQLQRDGGISYLQFTLLVRLADAADGWMRMTDLASSAVRSRSGLTYQVKLLLTAGYVSRRTAADDDRGVEVGLTAAGCELLARVTPGHIAIVADAMLTPITTARAPMFASTVIDLRDHLRRSAPPVARGRSSGA